MRKNYNKSTYRSRQWRKEFRKLSERMERAAMNGMIHDWSRIRKIKLFQRLQKLARRLRVPMKPAIIASLLTTGVIMKKPMAAATTPINDRLDHNGAYIRPISAYHENAYLNHRVAFVDETSALNLRPPIEGGGIFNYTPSTALQPKVEEKVSLPDPLTDTAMKAISMDNNSDFGANYGIYGGTLNYKKAALGDPTDPPKAPTQPKLANAFLNQAGQLQVNELPVLTGQAEKNTTITLESSVDGVLATNVQVDADGNWRIQLNQRLSTGTHHIVAKAANATGSSEASSALTLLTGDTQGNGTMNTATGNYAVVGGGNYNQASGRYSTVSGGFFNTASDSYSTVSGGASNEASNNYSTVSGGFGNTASSRYSTVSGGFGNTASGSYSNIPGGYNLKAKSYAEVVIGLNNDTTNYQPTTDAFIATDRLFIIGNGTDDSNRSNALVMLKNGDTQLNGVLSLSNGTDTLRLPNSDGTAGQVLQTDGMGNITFANASGGTGAFATSNNVTSNSPGDLAADDFVFGSDSLDNKVLTGTDDDARFFFDKSKAAFRAGVVEGDEWDEANVGSYSTVTGGKNNTAATAYATISGGGENAIKVDGTGSYVNYATIAGGYANEIFVNAMESYANHTTISGGGNNKIQVEGNGSYANYTTIGGGNSNEVEVDGMESYASYATIGGGVGNAIEVLRDGSYANYTTIGGGESNNVDVGGMESSASHATIGGGDGNAIEIDGDNSDATNATIGGGDSNAIEVDGNNSDANYATISGGSSNRIQIEDNHSYANYATVGGGGGNIISVEGMGSYANYTTISGGSDNEIEVKNNSYASYSTIGGGYSNTVDVNGIESYANYATIGGGSENEIEVDGNNASANYGTIGGGQYNYIKATTDNTNATHATIGGGYYNQVTAKAATIPGGYRLEAKSFGETVIGINNDTMAYTPN
ncbi:MAG: Ig-like domain-containing protein, partial [Bacteroidota bacterium]